MTAERQRIIALDTNIFISHFEENPEYETRFITNDERLAIVKDIKVTFPAS